MPTLLLWLLALPLGTAIGVACLGSTRAGAVRWFSLLCTLACLVLALIVAVHYAGPRWETPAPQATTVEFQPEMVTRWNLVPLGEGSGIQFYIGIDGLNVWLVLLTAFLMVPAVLVSWAAIEERTNEFYAWLLVLETAMIGVFLSFDIILFYVFFELTLVPLFFLIGIWGGSDKHYAARKFFLYTLTGSLITLLGVIGVVLYLYQDSKKITFAMPELVKSVDTHSRQLATAVENDRKELEEVSANRARAKEGERPELDRQVKAAATKLTQSHAEADYWMNRVQFWIFLALFCGFAVKVPLVPLHTWLPLAHTEAPTAGSVLLAGVLLKIGTYGFLRLCIPLAPDASVQFGTHLIGWLAVVGIIYGSFCALAQTDIKKMVAYSSVSHLGFCMLGMFALNEIGLSGSLLQMLNHGLSTGGLFLLVGMLYERYHTRKIADYGGMAARLHLMAVFWVYIILSSIGLPGLNGFVGEVLVLLGMYDFPGSQVSGRLLVSIGVFGVLLGAWYFLTLLREVFFGPLREPLPPHHHPITDLNAREIITLAPIAAVCLFLGVYPQPVLNTAGPDLQKVARIGAEAGKRPEMLSKARAAIQDAQREAAANPAQAMINPAPGE